MRYENLPIYKSAMDFCVYIETIVRGFEKYHKYTLGVDLRSESKVLMGLEEIKQFLSVQASFVGHSSHANSYNLQQKVGVIHESNPFDYDRG